MPLNYNTTLQRLAKLITALTILGVTACAIQFPNRLPREAIQTLQGHWYSKQAGYVATFNREHLDAYSFAGDSCFREDFSFRELAYELPDYRRISNDVIELGADGTMLRFNRIDLIPKACQTIPQFGPVEILKLYTDIMTEHYAFFDLHKIDWQSRVDKALAAVNTDTTEQQLFDQMVTLLEGIPDSHLGVLATIQGERRPHTKRYLRTLDPVLKPLYDNSNSDESYRIFRRNWISTLRNLTIQSVLGDSANSLADGKLVWGRVDDIGYLQVHQFLGYSKTGSPEQEKNQFAKHLDEIFSALSDTRHLVIDVSLSRGGFGDLAFELASRLSAATEGSGPLVHRNYPRNVGKALIKEEYLTPTKGTPYLKPVTIVASDATTSAAEEFLMAARILENVTLTGVPSNGSLSDVMEKSLPNGWLVVLSNEVFLSPGDELFEGSGIPVDQEVRLFLAPDPQDSYVAAIKNIIDRIKSDE